MIFAPFCSWFSSAAFISGPGGGDANDGKPDEWMLPSKIFGATCQVKKPDDEGKF